MKELAQVKSIQQLPKQTETKYMNTVSTEDTL